MADLIQEDAAAVKRRTLWPEERVERCEACNKRLAPGQHELCPRCDAAAFDALPLSAGYLEAAA